MLISTSVRARSVIIVLISTSAREILTSVLPSVDLVDLVSTSVQPSVDGFNLPNTFPHQVAMALQLAENSEQGPVKTPAVSRKSEIVAVISF